MAPMNSEGAKMPPDMPPAREMELASILTAITVSINHHTRLSPRANSMPS